MISITTASRGRSAVVGTMTLILSLQLGAEPPTPDPALVSGSLDNGLTYLIRPTSNSSEPVEFRLVIDAGSALEEDDQRGVAHLIEHVGFRNTTRYPDGSLITTLQSLGSEFGPHVNAFTSFDQTVFKLSLDAADPHNLETGLNILREWAGEIVFSEQAVEAEREVVAAEWSSLLGPNQRLLHQALNNLYHASRYANRLPIGDLESIRSVSLDRITAFYRQWYRPDNMAVIVSGPVDPRAIANAIQGNFSDLPLPSQPLAKPDPDLPSAPGIISSVATDSELGYNVMRLIFPHDRIVAADANAMRRRVVIDLIGSILTQRLEQRKERSSAPFLLGRATYGSSVARSQEEFTLLALVADGGVETGLTVLIEECERFLRFGATPDEAIRAQTNLQRAADTVLAESAKRSSAKWADALVSSWLKQEPVAAPAWTHAQVSAALDALSPEQLAASAKKLLLPARSLVRLDLAMKPGNPPPHAQQIQTLVRVARAAEIENTPEATAAPTSLLPDLPPPGSVVSRQTFPNIGITELQLANGIKVLLKPTDFTATEVLFSAQRPGGFLSQPAELELATKFAPAYLGEAGLGNLRKSDLVKLLSGKQAAVAVRFDPYLDVIKGQTTTSDLETALQLIHLTFRAPRSDQNAFQTVVGMNQAFESNVIMNPVMSFLDEVMVRRNNRHPRAPRLIQPAEAWQQLSVEQVVTAYRNRMEDTRGFTFFFAGSFEDAAITPLIEKYIGSLPGTPLPTSVAEPSWPDVGIRQKSGPIHEIVARGPDPKSLLVFTQQHPIEAWTSRETHLLWSLGNILRRALLDQLRIEQNQVYTLQVNSTLERIPFEHYLAEIVIPCRPGDEAMIAAGLKAQIERLRTVGPTKKELQQEIQFQQSKERREQTSNGDWMWKLELIEQYNETYQRLQNPNTLIDWLTPEALRQVAQKHLHPDRWLQYDLRPKS
ncbi:insulinase family protein [Opitutaceae bacterium]|nr:insulinase family protein [Opitutaceae bacterium]